MKRTLDAWLAACALCVTMRIVCPSALISPNTERSADAAFESSAPVGSSARISLGFVINALGDAEVGFYNAAVKIKSILVCVVTSLGTVLLPRASYYIEHKMLDEFDRIT